MNVSMNADWARFKALGIARLGRAGFAEWLQHAADVMRVEAKREALNAEDADASGPIRWFRRQDIGQPIEGPRFSIEVEAPEAIP